jgi:hypothetical protein
VNSTARTDITSAGWPLGVSNSGGRNVIRVAVHARPDTARPGQLAPEAVMATTSGQRPADADTLPAGYETVAGHTTSRSGPW